MRMRPFNVVLLCLGTMIGVGVIAKKSKTVRGIPGLGT